MSWPPDMVQRMKDLRKQKRSMSQIAEILSQEYSVDVSKNAVIGRFNRMKMTWSTRPPKLEVREDQAPSLMQCSPKEGCKWPLWDAVVTHEYCGAERLPGMSWCEEHKTRVFQPYSRYRIGYSQGVDRDIVTTKELMDREEV